MREVYEPGLTNATYMHWLALNLKLALNLIYGLAAHRKPNPVLPFNCILLTTRCAQHDGYQSTPSDNKRTLAFIFDLRPFARNAIFCRLPDADAAAAEFLDARRARRLFPSGRIRHRRIRSVALGLHGTPAA